MFDLSRRSFCKTVIASAAVSATENAILLFGSLDEKGETQIGTGSIMDSTAVAARLHGAAEKGFVLSGTWISPCEQAVFAELAAAGFPLVRAVQDPLSTIYRPKGDEPGLFATGRYLLLSRVSAPGVGRGAAWHGINDALAALARNSGGAAVYVHRVAGEAAPRWDF